MIKRKSETGRNEMANLQIGNALVPESPNRKVWLADEPVRPQGGFIAIEG